MSFAGEIRKAIEGYIGSSPLLLKLVNFFYHALLWDNYATFGIVAGIVFVDYIFVTSTAWRVLPYIFILILEFYLVLIALKTVTPFLNAPDEEAQQSLTSTLDYVFNKIASCLSCNGECHNPLDDIAALREFQKTPFYKPTLVAVGLLLGALISAIFPGSFIAFVTIFGLLLAPGIISHGLHIQAYDKVWVPIVLPNYEKFAKPHVDKYWAILKGQAPPESSGSAPADAAPVTRDYSAPAAAPEPSEVSAPPASEPAPGGGEGGDLDLNALLGSIGNLAQSLDEQ